MVPLTILRIVEVLVALALAALMLFALLHQARKDPLPPSAEVSGGGTADQPTANVAAPRRPLH